MSIDMVQAIEALPGWGPMKEITTKSGMMRRKIMTPPHRDFWSFWKANQKLMQENGYQLVKKDGAWYALRFVQWIAPNTLQRLLEESEAKDSGMVLLRPPGLEYMPFQRGGVKYCTDRLFGRNGMPERHGVLIADQPGLGKTIQAIGILNQDPEIRDRKTLVVCPASLKLNWRNEMRKWMVDGLGHSAVVTKDKWPGTIGASVVITNYDVLHKFAKEIRQVEWDYTIFDEAHALKNEQARRTKFALGGVAEIGDRQVIVPAIKARKWVFLTGTPMENAKAGEMFPLIEKCDPHGMGASRAKFVARYQKTDEFLEELQTRMRAAFMVRRLKQDVLKELPPKIRKVITIDVDSLDKKDAVIFGEEMRMFKEYQEVLSSWAVRTELAKAEGLDAYKAVIREKKASIGMTAGELARLRQKTAVAKVKGVIEQVKIVLEESECMILFAHHISVLDKLQEGLEKAKISFVRVDGSTKVEDRQKAVEDFQAGKFQVFLGGLKPCGVGITLTRAQVVAFVELDWLPGQMQQAEDRAHRIGQRDTVLVLHLVMEGSLDEYMAKRLIEKQDLIDRALDSMGEDEDEDQKDEQREGFATGAPAATKGASQERLAEESKRITLEGQEAIQKALDAFKAEGFMQLGGTDREIAMALCQGGLTPLKAALARRIALKYKSRLDEEIVSALALKPKEKP